MKQRQIPADAGHIAWDMDQFNFIDEQDAFDSIHPSLHRIAKLNQNYGLYEVTKGIYQVRGLDLAQITFIRGKTGWIAYDVLVSAETARASWEAVPGACRRGPADHARSSTRTTMATTGAACAA
jgi:alkyl sulfatase BDS1-like metallo-beta-lactamase superfamily hydrolase